MLSIPFQESNQNQTRILNIKGIEDLNCTVYEISERQDYGLPQIPLDNGTFISDTIYKNPKVIDVRVLVNESDIATFKANVESSQFSNTMFTVTSLNGETYSNLKITNMSNALTSAMTGKRFFIISFLEIKLVKALVESYQTSKNAGYTSNKNVGTKDGKEQKTTALKGFIK